MGITQCRVESFFLSFGQRIPRCSARFIIIAYAYHSVSSFVHCLRWSFCINLIDVLLDHGVHSLNYANVELLFCNLIERRRVD
jgi:hypothetical protein